MKKVIFIIVSLLLLITIPVVVYFVGQQQDIRSKAAPATSLQFNPQTMTEQIGDSFPVNIQINTGTNSIASIKIQLTFDSSILEAESITNGTLAPNITASGIVAPGSASITVSAASTTSPITGSGTVAVVRFKAKTATTVPTSVKFDSTTYASAFNETQNAIVSTVPASITILSAVTSINSASSAQTGTTSLTPTATPTTALTSTSATSSATTSALNVATSAITITLPQDGQMDVPTHVPTIGGTAPVGSTITIIIDPPHSVGTVVTDQTGNWLYVSDLLATGKHSLTATAVATDGSTTVASIKFGVLGNTDEGTASGIGGAMPQTGTTETTLLLLLSAVFFIGFGISLQR